MSPPQLPTGFQWDGPQTQSAPNLPSGYQWDEPPGQTPTAMGDAPAASTLETFLHNLPQYPGALASRFADLAKRATTGEILPQSANMPGGERGGDIGSVLSAASMGMPLAPAGLKLPFAAPTEAALEASKTARYESPALTQFTFKPEAGEDVSNIIKTDLKAGKLDQFNAPDYYQIADRLKTPRFGDNLTVSDFEAARKDAQVLPSGEGNDKRGASIVRKAIDNYLGNIPENHVLSGDAGAANDALVKARADNAALERSKEVTTALARAENKTGNLETLTKNQLRPILDIKTGVSKVPGFEDYTPEEIDALKKAMFPGFIQNQIGELGKHLASSGGVGHTGIGLAGGLTASHFGASPYESAAIGLGLMGAGRGLGNLAGRMAEQRANYLGNLLRTRSALAGEMNPNQIIPPFWPRTLGLPVPMPAIGVNSEQPL